MVYAFINTIKRIIPGLNPTSISKKEYDSSLVLVLDNSTDYIPFAEIFGGGKGDNAIPEVAFLTPFVIWTYIFIFLDIPIWKKIIGVLAFFFLIFQAAEGVLSGWQSTVLGGDLERPFKYLQPTVSEMPGIGVQKLDHSKFLKLKATPTIMYLITNNWITDIQGSTGFLIPAKDFFKAAAEAKIEARDLYELTNNVLTSDAVATSAVRKTAGTSINDEFIQRSMTLSKVGFYMAYAMIVYITFSDPSLSKVTSFLVKNMAAVLVSMAVILFDIHKITATAINKTLLIKRDLMFLAYSVCLMALL